MSSLVKEEVDISHHESNIDQWLHKTICTEAEITKGETCNKSNKQILSDIINIFEADVIPPETDLLQWRNRLRYMGKLALETPIVASDHGNFTFETVESALKLIKAKGIQESVMQEINCFQISGLQPHSVSEYPTSSSIKQFQRLIMDFPHNHKLPSIGITSDELSRLWHKRYLSGDHVHYFINRLNNLDKENHSIHLNRISDVDKYMGNLREKHIKPKTLSFIANVGMDQRGKIFIGSDCRHMILGKIFYNMVIHWAGKSQII